MSMSKKIGILRRQGKTNAQIARHLKVSVETIEAIMQIESFAK
jgi:DNA-binding CsgD family transcriptional regulator